MPLKSQAQRRWMHATHPEMADRWEKHTKKKNLPERVKSESLIRRIDEALASESKSRVRTTTYTIDNRLDKVLAQLEAVKKRDRYDPEDPRNEYDAAAEDDKRLAKLDADRREARYPDKKEED